MRMEGIGEKDKGSASNVLTGQAHFRRREQQAWEDCKRGIYSGFCDERDMRMEGIGEVVRKEEAGVETNRDIPVSWNGTPQPWRSGLQSLTETRLRENNELAARGRAEAASRPKVEVEASTNCPQNDIECINDAAGGP
jgi:hypothetical protein